MFNKFVHGIFQLLHDTLNQAAIFARYALQKSASFGNVFKLVDDDFFVNLFVRLQVRAPRPLKVGVALLVGDVNRLNQFVVKFGVIGLRRPTSFEKFFWAESYRQSPTLVQRLKTVFSENLNIFTMNILTVTFVHRIKYWSIQQQIEKVTVNIKATRAFVRIVPFEKIVPWVKIKPK